MAHEALVSPKMKDCIETCRDCSDNYPLFGKGRGTRRTRACQFIASMCGHLRYIRPCNATGLKGTLENM